MTQTQTFETRLTPTELELLELLASGLTQRQIATIRGRSAHTIFTQVCSIISKLDAENTANAVARGFRLGLIT